jgi:hypothetical protein
VDLIIISLKIDIAEKLLNWHSLTQLFTKCHIAVIQTFYDVKVVLENTDHLTVTIVFSDE